MKRGGPTTEKGKAVVKWNATRHGISSPAPVIPGLEKREDWQDHRDGILDNLSPEGHLEYTLAERVALLSWRLHRVTRYETESVAISQGEVEEDIHRRARFLRLIDASPYEPTPKSYAKWPNTTGRYTTRSNAFHLSNPARS